MKDHFPAAVDFVIALEGGIANNPHDKGGLTKWGISKRSYPDLDIESLTREQAIFIYRRDFWDAVGCGRLEWGFALALFDSAVVQGPAISVAMLQNALRVKPDGILGDITVGAAQGAKLIPVLADFFAQRAVRFAMDKTFATFGRGWFKRLFLVFAKCLAWR